MALEFRHTNGLFSYLKKKVSSCSGFVAVQLKHPHEQSPVFRIKHAEKTRFSAHRDKHTTALGVLPAVASFLKCNTNHTDYDC